MFHVITRKTLLQQLVYLLMICCLPGHLWAQTSDKLNLSITPYIWASNTKVDLTLDDAGIGEGEISFKDLLDVLDTAGGNITIPAPVRPIADNHQIGKYRACIR